MILRPEQLRAFQAAAQRSFEAEVADHVKHAFPAAAAGIGDAALRALVGGAIQRAERYGYKARGALQMFVDFAVLLGHEFDRDPMLYWIRDILTDSDGLDEMTQAARVHLHVSTYLNLVYGDKGEHVGKALEHLANARPEELTAVGRAFESSAERWLQALHPRKCAYAGGDALARLIAKARPATQAARLPETEGPPLVLGLMFAFGSGVATDPLFPWIAGSVAGTEEPQTRLARLTARTQTYMRQALERRKSG